MAQSAYYYALIAYDGTASATVPGITVTWTDLDNMTTLTDSYGVSVIPASSGDPNLTWVSIGGSADNGVYYEFQDYQVVKVSTPTNYTEIYLDESMDEPEFDIITHPTDLSPTYGTSGYLCTTGTVEGGTMYYKLGSSGSYSTSRPTASGLNAGSYTLYYYAASDNGYEETRDYSITVTVAKASGSVTITNASPTYGTNGALVNVSNATGTMHYRIGSSGSYSTSIPTASGLNVGSYTLYYYAEQSTNYFGHGSEFKPKTMTVSVSKANQNFSISPTSKTLYNTSGYNSFTITPLNAYGNMEYHSTDSNVATVNASGVVTYVGAGSCNIAVIATGNGNYNAGAINCAVTCVVDTVESLSITIGENPITCNQTTSICVSATYKSGYVNNDFTSSVTLSTNPTGIILII